MGKLFLMISTVLTSIVFQLVGYSFEGVYDVEGAGPRNGYKPYTGTLTITKDVNGIYQATWDLVKSQGTCTYVGTGISINDSVISFVFADVLEKKDIGIISYSSDDQGLSGIFTHLNNNLIGTETLKWLGEVGQLSERIK